MKLNKAHLRYPTQDWNAAPNSYWQPPNISEWDKCRRCGLRPRIRVTNDMRRTSCGCWRSEGDRWQIAAEARSSYVRRKGCDKGYDRDALRENWNTYCRTGKLKFKLGTRFRFGFIWEPLLGIVRKQG